MEQVVPWTSGLIRHKNVRNHFLSSKSYAITLLCHWLQLGKRAVFFQNRSLYLPTGSRDIVLCAALHVVRNAVWASFHYSMVVLFQWVTCHRV